jgi:hypothetical protein
MKKCSFLSFLLLFGCFFDPTKYGNVASYDSSFGSSSAFLFKVEEVYLEKNKDSKLDENYPIMTVAEVKLLKSLMKRQKYCLNKYNKPNFVITSRQEKIYDTTFAGLIEQSYNAKAVSPRIYFGKCS